MHMQTEAVSSHLNGSTFVQKLVYSSFKDCEIHIGGHLIFTFAL